MAIVVLEDTEVRALMLDAAAQATAAALEHFKHELPNLKLHIEHPDILVPRERVMEMLKVSERTLVRWERDGELVPVRHGRLVFYRNSDLLKHDPKKKGGSRRH